jgi:TRAP-type C4-dicarboxylate transport system permease small subunit
MKIQMMTAMVLCAVFGVAAFTGGFLSLQAMQATTDAAEIDAARGYAYFYFFIGAATSALAILAYRFRDYKY